MYLGPDPNCHLDVEDKSGDKPQFIGGTETSQQCVDAVIKETPKAKGATWTTNLESCYAEFGTERIEGGRNCHTIIFEGKLVPLKYST